MSWFRWKGKQEPWGDNFSIVTVTFPTTGFNEPKRHVVPYNQHLHLIGVYIQINPGVLPPTMYASIRAERGGILLYYMLAAHPGPVVGISRSFGADCLTRTQDRNSSHIGSWPLPSQFYLYPHDIVYIDASTQGAGNWTLMDCSLTFKQWITS